MPTDHTLVLVAASAAAFALALLSSVAGFGGGVLLLPVFTALFGLRVAVPVLTLTQLSSNGARVWLNRHELRWPLVRWFALGAVPFAVAGGLLLAHAPLGPLKRLLGLFLIAVVVWRRINPHPRKPADTAFARVGAVSGLGSALLHPMLRRCDEQQVGAYLETGTQKNVRFYSRHGFRVTDEVPLPKGPPMWLMWRDPL